MIRWHARLPVLAILAGTLLLGGCRSGERGLFLGAVGRYDGFAMVRDSRGSEPLLVRGDLKAVAPNRLALSLKPPAADAAAPGREWDFALTVRSSRRLTLSSIQLLPQETELRPDGNGCFAAPAGGILKTLRLCFDGRELSLDLTLAGDTGFAMTIDRYLADEQPVAETPAPYTVAQLRTLAEKQGFDSRIEFDRVTEARRQALNAHLNLFPHISAGDVLGLITFSWQGLVRMVGDLAPFVLVNRLFRAHEVQQQYLAEQDSLVVMKADSANISEGLALGILRDEEARRRLASYIQPLTDLRDRMRDRELLGVLPPGSSDSLTTVVDELDQTLIGLELTLAEEYMALAQAVGFVSPKAVAAVTESDLPGVERAEAIDADATGVLAIERSVELRQMDHLIKAARAERNARFFDWMDPSNAVGAALVPYIGISNAMIDELQDRRRQTESILLQKVGRVGKELEASVRLYAISAQDLGIQQRRVSRIMDQLQLGVPVSFADLQTAMQAQMKADLDQVNARFEYGVAAAKLNRVLFAGPYLALRPSAPR